VHFPPVVQLTLPLSVVQLKPSSELEKFPPALLQLASRLDWEIPLRETLPANAAPAENQNAAIAHRMSAYTERPDVSRRIEASIFLPQIAGCATFS